MKLYSLTFFAIIVVLSILDGLERHKDHKTSGAELLSAACSCVETDNLAPGGTLVYCDDFESYSEGMISTQSDQWILFDPSSVDALVEEKDQNQFLRIRDDNGSKSDVIYLLDTWTTGRVRLSWKLLVEEDASAYFDILKTVPVEDFNEDIGPAVSFDPDGTGVFRCEERNIDFQYLQNIWINVMLMIDLDDQSVELWLDNNFVGVCSFEFDGHTREVILGLAGISFYAERSDNDFIVDKICVWRNNLCGLVDCETGDPTCVRNGIQYSSQCEASICGLYTALEWDACISICDQGGPLISRSDRFTGQLGDNLAPSTLLQDQCIIDAYGGSIPSGPIYSDIYIFYNNMENPIDPYSFIAQSSSTKAFVLQCDSGQEFDIIDQQNLGEINFDGDGCVYDPDPLRPVGFYFLIVIGNELDNYGFEIFPDGNCPFDAPLITIDTSFSGSTDGEENNFQVSAVGDYSSCYNGLREYDGADITYSFLVEDPGFVTISVNAKEQTGIFLYNYLCGDNCLSYSENPNLGGDAVIDRFALSEGIYYLVVDQNAGISDQSFTISLNFETDSNFVSNYFLDFNCPVDNSKIHQVNIPEEAFAFTQNTQIVFTVSDFDKTRAIDGLNQYWNGTPLMVFNVPADGESSEKCSYQELDSFELFIFKQPNFSRIRTELIFQNSDQSTFQNMGNSTINKISRVEQVYFDIGASNLTISSLGAEKGIQVITGVSWYIAEPQSVSWIRFDSISSDGNLPIIMTVDPNPNTTTRKDSFDFIFQANPPLKRTLTITQFGECITPEVEIQGSDLRPSLCIGESTELSATLLNLNSDDAKFMWSTGENTNMISVSPLENTSYSVTVTSLNCISSNSAEITIDVNAPPEIEATSDQTICPDSSIILMVQAPQSSTFEWSTNDTVNAVEVAPLQETEYSVSVTLDGCITTEKIIVDVFPPLTYDSTISPASENQGGQIDLEIMGGSPPYICTWFDEEGTIIGNDHMILGLERGIYSAEVIDANGCGLIIQGLEVDSLTSSSFDLNKYLGLTIYPNPATSTFFIDSDRVDLSSLRIYVTDILGGRVNGKIERNTDDVIGVHLDKTRPGIYFINIVYNDRLGTSKIVIQ